MAYDGIPYGARVDNFGERKLAAKVTDSILTSVTYASRAMGQAESWGTGKTRDFNLKTSISSTGEWFLGMPTFNTTTTNNNIVLSYSFNAYHQPAVSVLLEAFANMGDMGIINLGAYKMEEAKAEAVYSIGQAIFGTGSSLQILGLGAIVDDGTDVGIIGGQSRTTYTMLKAGAKTAATSGQLSLSFLASLDDAASAAGSDQESPTIDVTTKTGWTLYESVLQPTVRSNYEAYGKPTLPLRGTEMMSNKDGQARGGFSSLIYRGRAVIKDDACTSGNWFMLNERYNQVFGFTQAPSEFKGYEPVDMGTAPKTIEGLPADPSFAPPSSAGWFHLPYQNLPMQPGAVSRFFFVGQFTTRQPRRNSRGTGITTV